jgi:hypothetical protein
VTVAARRFANSSPASLRVNNATCCAACPDAVATAPMPFSSAAIEHGRGRVHDARVDVPEPLQREQVRCVLGVLEDLRPVW